MLQQARRLRLVVGDYGKPVTVARRAIGATWYDPSLYLLAFVIGLVPIVAVLLKGGAWGAEPTVGMLFCIFSAGALARRTFGTFAARDRNRSEHKPDF